MHDLIVGRSGTDFPPLLDFLKPTPTALRVRIDSTNPGPLQRVPVGSGIAIHGQNSVVNLTFRIVSSKECTPRSKLGGSKIDEVGSKIDEALIFVPPQREGLVTPPQQRPPPHTPHICPLAPPAAAKTRNSSPTQTHKLTQHADSSPTHTSRIMVDSDTPTHSTIGTHCVHPHGPRATTPARQP